VELSDTSHGVARTEVRSARVSSHLGHLFPNGSADAGSMRSGINSAALRFIAAKDLDAEGYGRYGRLFASDVESKPTRVDSTPFADDHQREVANATIKDVETSGLWPGPVVTEVTPAVTFWEAEPEHQDYLIKHPGGYTCHFVRPQWHLPSEEQAG
jgi:hypothetical protein